MAQVWNYRYLFRTRINFVSCKIWDEEEKFFEPYLRFYVDGRSPVPIVSSSECLVKKIPKVIKIISSSFSEVFDNATKSKVIKITHLPKEGVETFKHFDFSNHEWIDIEEKEVNRIDITLVDENDEQLRLASGTPTYVKLHFSSSIPSPLNPTSYLTLLLRAGGDGCHPLRFFEDCSETA